MFDVVKVNVKQEGGCEAPQAVVKEKNKA